MEIGLAVRERLAASEATYAGRRTRALHVGVLGIGAFLLAAIFVLQVHDYTVVPDEIGYVKQAQHIWEAHALARPDFFYYYSVAQLLPLISAPIFGLLPIVTALKVAHLLYAALLASVVLPAYLL